MFAYLSSYVQSIWDSIFGPLFMLSSSSHSSRNSGRLLVLGLDNAGKTTLLQAIRRYDATSGTKSSGSNTNTNHNHPALRSYPPTDRPEHIKNIVTINHQITFHAYDLGGHEAVRHLWSDYYQTNDSSADNHNTDHSTSSSNQERHQNLAILFCIDIADRARIEEAAYELDALIHDGLQQQQQQQHPDRIDQNNYNSNLENTATTKNGIPIAILLTKCDDMHEVNTNHTTTTSNNAPMLMTLPEVSELIDYPSLQHNHQGPMHICTVSVYRNTGYMEALRWITKTLLQQHHQPPPPQHK